MMQLRRYMETSLNQPGLPCVLFSAFPSSTSTQYQLLNTFTEKKRLTTRDALSALILQKESPVMAQLGCL